MEGLLLCSRIAAPGHAGLHSSSRLLPRGRLSTGMRFPVLDILSDILTVHGFSLSEGVHTVLNFLSVFLSTILSENLSGFTAAADLFSGDASAQASPSLFVSFRLTPC